MPKRILDFSAQNRTSRGHGPANECGEKSNGEEGDPPCLNSRVTCLGESSFWEESRLAQDDSNVPEPTCLEL
jgi:hypothetical protein